MSGNVVLVTGGTGKTGRRLVQRLEKSGVSVRVASRKPENAPQARLFDWGQPDTWKAALEGVASAYLVAPPTGDSAPVMTDFIQAATRQGVARFVLLSASLLPMGGPGPGQVHLWLQQNAAQWTVLRPSWFMQNLSEGQHLATIRDEGVICSATGDGRVAFIDADDIAAAAHAALTSRTASNRDFVLTGERPVSYDEVAMLISNVTGRTITHRRLTAPELAARHQSRGLPPTMSQVLASMDSAIAGGAEDRVTEGLHALTGHAAARLETFVAANAPRWALPLPT